MRVNVVESLEIQLMEKGNWNKPKDNGNQNMVNIVVDPRKDENLRGLLT